MGSKDEVLSELSLALPWDYFRVSHYSEVFRVFQAEFRTS